MQVNCVHEFMVPSPCRYFQSATYEYGGEDDYHDIRYIRLNNTPNHTVLHAKLAAIGAEAAMVAASGMARYPNASQSSLQGDHILLQDYLYGGTHDLSQDLPARN